MLYQRSFSVYLPFVLFIFCITYFVVHEDEGFFGENTHGPQFQKMIKDTKRKKFTHLICYRLDRIIRNVSDFSTTIEELKKYGIEFISVKEQFDTTLSWAAL